MGIAGELGGKVANLHWASIDDQALHWAKAGILDIIGVTLAGASEDCARIAARAVATGRPLGGDDGPALVLGFGRRTGVLDAAFVNGVSAHALDFDDCSNTLGGHPSAPLVPCLMALGEEMGMVAPVGGRDLIVAYLAGYEVECALARGVNFHHYEKGWHPTATLGTLGAAAACAKLLGLDADGIALALGLAVSLSSGLKANFGTMTKPLHLGQTNRNGLLAALLARDGFTANRQSFEHPQGFFEVFDGAGNYDTARIVPGFADPFDIVEPGLVIKRHPCCGSTHPAIDALLELRTRHGLGPDNVDHILSWIHARRLTHTFRPDPQSELDAKFSIQYVLARALMHGQIRIEHFDAGAYNDAQARAVMARITAEPHPSPTDISDEHFFAEVKVTMKSGEVHSLALEEAVGRGSEGPLPAAAVRDKFDDCAARLIAPDKVAELGDMVEALETLDDIRALSTIIGHAGAMEEIGARPSLSTAAG